MGWLSVGRGVSVRGYGESETGEARIAEVSPNGEWTLWRLFVGEHCVESGNANTRATAKRRAERAARDRLWEAR